MSLPAGPTPVFPDEQFLNFTIPDSARIFKSGGWTLDGDQENNSAI
jgi:hypothetical protein